jgi:hypothetical protein
MRDSDTPDLGVDWGGSPAAATTRMPAAPRHTEPATKPDLLTATTEIPRTKRLGKPGSGRSAATSVGAAGGSASGAPRTGTITATASVSPAAPPGSRYGRGVAVPSRPQTRQPSHTEATPRQAAPAEPRRPWSGPEGKFAALSGGGEFSIVGALFAFICWGVWAFANSRASMVAHILYLVLVLVVAVAVFAMARLLGTLVLVRLFRRTRRTARLSHLTTGVFLVITGIGFLSNVGWVMDTTNWIKNLF